MFDTYHKHEKEFVPYEKTVIEKRAPTDDSIRIYHELLEKAKSELIQLEDFHHNNIKAKYAVMQRVVNYTVDCIVKIDLNGTVLTRSFIGDKYEFDNNAELFYEKLKDCISNCITDYVLRNITEFKEGVKW